MPNAYDITMVPEAIPLTTPVPGTTDATEGLLLVQIPPMVGSVSVILSPTHTCVGPLIGPGAAITVTVVVAAQPPAVYDISVVPLLMPVTRPEVETTVATVGVILLQAPPPTPSLSVRVEPTQILPAPVIAVGTGFTVITTVTLQPVPIVYLIVSVPGRMPVNVPAGAIVATAGVVCVHVPPGVASVNVALKPTHTCAVPLMADGKGLTVIALVVWQPVLSRQITVPGPGDMPVTMPVPALIVAVPPRMAQVIPGVMSVSVMVEPTQTTDGPAIAAGSGLTVTGSIAGQPAPTAYEIEAMPADTPVTIPVADTDPVSGALLVHVPPGVTSDSVIVLPTHTEAGPLIADGPALTVTVRVTVHTVPPSV